MDLARDESSLIGGPDDTDESHTIGTEVIAGGMTVAGSEVQSESADEDDVKTNIVLHVHDIKQERK